MCGQWYHVWKPVRRDKIHFESIRYVKYLSPACEVVDFKQDGKPKTLQHLILSMS